MIAITANLLYVYSPPKHRSWTRPGFSPLLLQSAQVVQISVLCVASRGRRARLRDHRRAVGRRVQLKTVVGLHQIFHPVLLETHKALQRRRLLASTVRAVHHVTLLLLSYKQNVENFDLGKIQNAISFARSAFSIDKNQRSSASFVRTRAKSHYQLNSQQHISSIYYKKKKSTTRNTQFTFD